MGHNVNKKKLIKKSMKKKLILWKLIPEKMFMK